MTSRNIPGMPMPGPDRGGERTVSTDFAVIKRVEESILHRYCSRGVTLPGLGAGSGAGEPVNRGNGYSG